MSQASPKEYESILQLDGMAPSCVSSKPETRHGISNRFHDGIQSSSNGVSEDVCADESSNHDGDNHLDDGGVKKEKSYKSCESKESLKQEKVKKVSACSGDQTAMIKGDQIGENITASINGEDQKSSDVEAEKDDTKQSVSRTDANQAAENKLHGKNRRKIRK